MKIVLNTQDDGIINNFITYSRKEPIEIINARLEKILFDSIQVGDVDAFVLENSSNYCQKAIDFIKKKQPYIPIIILGDEWNGSVKQKLSYELNNTDITLPFVKEKAQYLYRLIINNILSYKNNFNALQRLTTKIKKKINFGDCTYDPNLRILYYKNKEISTLSQKSGGIIEMLAINFGQLVKKELILEKVWLSNDYFSSRSMDVYITNIRKIFRDNNISMEIKTVSKSGLILKWAE